MKIFVTILISIIAAALVSFAVVKTQSPVTGAMTTAPAKQKETVYERIIRTGKIRCGYIPYSYFFRLDPNTGAFSGVNYEITNEVGRLMNLKIEWTEELTWATVVTALQTGRVDAFCSGMWIDTQAGKFLSYTQPLYFTSVSAYGRADETRFSKLDDLNNPSVRAISRDGGTPGIVARQDFPKATVISLPSGVSDGEMLAYLTTSKADVIFYGDDYLLQYMHENPGQLKALFPDKKLRVYATAIAFVIDDPALKNMFDNAVTELKGSRIIEKVLQKEAPLGGWMLERPD